MLPSRRIRKSERPTSTHHVSYGKLLRYIRPYWPRLLVALFALLVASLLGLIFPLFIQRLLDTVLKLESATQLNELAAGLVIVFALQSFFRFLEGYNMAIVGEYIIIDVRRDLFNSLLRLSLGFHTESRVGEMVSRISSDATKLRSILTNDIGVILSQTVALIGSLALMVALNWRLMGFLLIIIPIMVGIGTVFGYFMKRISSERQDALADSSVVVEEALTGIRVVKSFVREPFEAERFNDEQMKTYRVGLRMIRLRQSFGPAMTFLGFGSLAMFLWFGGREVLEGRLTGGQLAAFMFYGMSVAGSISSFVRLYADIQEALGATRRIFEIIEAAPDVADAPNAIPLPHVAGRITFENVSFAYDPRSAVLNDINLTIQPGEAIALVGPSGAGKTTLFNLIPRFYDPDSGRICIDGINIREVMQDSLRTQIGLVPQDTQLFGGTIRDNILYGRLDATDEELIAAARAANAHDFITEFPDGYDTVVGERGVKLSGGQRQRVAIARAVLKDPRILLLDEATSSLDSASEGLVQEALDRLMKGRTTVIIAHRLSTIRAVDRIAVLDQGRIVELGTHTELMALNGLYAKLYQMQFREVEAAMEA